jgi:hypothetical protein
MMVLTSLVLWVLPLWFLGLVLVGETAVWILAEVARARSRSPTFHELGLAERAIWDLALGTAVTVLYAYVLTELSVRIDEESALALLVVPAILLVYRVVRSGATLTAAVGRSLRTERWEILGVALVFAVSLGVRLWSYAGSYVYAGDDIRFFTMYTQRLLTTGRMFSSLGPALAPGWLAVPELHQFFSGSEAVFGVYSLWVPGTVTQMPSALTVLFNAAIPLSVYALGRALFRDRPRWIPIAIAALLAVATPYPLSFLSWGGIDETVGWVVFPVALAGLLLLLSKDRLDPGQWVVVALLIGGLAIISPLPVVYVLLFAAAFLIEWALRHGPFWTGASRLFLPVLAGLVIAAPAIASGVVAWQSGAMAAMPGPSGWGTFQTAPIFQYGEWSQSAVRFLTNSTPVWSGAIIVVLGWIGMGVNARSVRWVPSLILASAFLILLNENGPFGLYWVRFPGWSALFPDRPAILLFVPLSFGVALLADRLVRGARGSKGDPTPSGSADPGSAGEGSSARVGPPARSGSSEHRSRPPGLRRRSRSGWAYAAGVGLVLVLCVGAAVVTVPENNTVVAWATGFTPDDLTAFQWLDAHYAAGSTVLVDNADAGNWIPVFTDLREFPDNELISNATLALDYQTMVSEIKESNYSMYARLAQAYDLSAVYYGARIAYSRAIELPAAPLLQPPYIDFFTSNAHLCIPDQPPWIAVLSCENDTVSIRGPIAYSANLTENGAVVEIFNGTVPAGAELTFVLRDHTAQYPGNWTVRLSSQPLASVAYTQPGTSVEVLALNPEYAATTCTVAPFSTCAPTG